MLLVWGQEFDQLIERWGSNYSWERSPRSIALPVLGGALFENESSFFLSLLPYIGINIDFIWWRSMRLIGGCRQLALPEWRPILTIWNITSNTAEVTSLLKKIVGGELVNQVRNDYIMFNGINLPEHLPTWSVRIEERLSLQCLASAEWYRIGWLRQQASKGQSLFNV